MQKSSKKVIIVVGAGASGLMAARELARAGRQVVLLEGLDRIGGRIWTIREGLIYPLEAGAEFVHGEAKITRSLMQEAGLTYLASTGEWWVRDKKGLSKFDKTRPFRQIINQQLPARLSEVKEDISVSEFLATCVRGGQYAELRRAILFMASQYEAADPKRLSLYSVSADWLKTSEHGRIKEGYDSLLKFLEAECRKYNVQICLSNNVESVQMSAGSVTVHSREGQSYSGVKAILTVPPPVLSEIRFQPDLPLKREAASKIGFGNVIKVFLQFKNRWWAEMSEGDMAKLLFLYSEEEIPVWWTQYPDEQPLLLGWKSDPDVAKYKNVTVDKIIDISLASLVRIFSVEKKTLKGLLSDARVFNWQSEPLAKGAYSYPTLETPGACAELLRSESDTIFFAGEALNSDGQLATVEAALASGLEVARRIISNGAN